MKVSKIKRIIFLTEYPINKWDYDRLGIETLQSNGFGVEIWDLTPFLRPKAYLEIKIKESVDFKNLSVFFYKKEISTRLKELDASCFIICLLPYSLETVWIFRLISKYRIPYGVIIANAIPFSVRDGRRNIFKKLFKELPKLRLHNLFTRAFAYLPYGLLGVSPASVILAGGEKSLLSLRYPFSLQRTRIIWVHALDYDIYLKENNPAGKKDTVVFLDENLPFHTDYLYLKIKPFSSAQDYYPALCRFFSVVEQKTGSKVIIAAHPRSNYQSQPDYFEGREVVKGRTAQLVRDSRFVIAHVSTAINYAVLFKKPVVFVATDSINLSFIGQWLRLFSSALNKNIINLSGQYSFDPEKELTIDQDKYSQYRNDFIKKDGSENILFWELFSKSLNCPQL